MYTFLYLALFIHCFWCIIMPPCIQLCLMLLNI